MDILQIVALLFMFLITLAVVVIAAYLVIKFLQDRAKNKDFVDKHYIDMTKFTIEQCPDSLFDYELTLASNAKVEGRTLGKIKGYYYGEVYNERIDKSDHRQIGRAHV